MGKRSNSTRVTVEIGNKARCLLSIAEMPSGDLILNLYLKARDGSIPRPFAEDGVDDKERGELISEYRYTIHTSPNSSKETNTIKLHKVMESGSTELVYLRTDAIKAGNKFQPIYARLCSSLSGPGYDLKSGRGAIECLGKTNYPLTLVFAVFVAPPRRKFVCPVTNGNHRRLRFREFSLHILWSYLTVPPTDHGRIMHFATLEGVSKGCDAVEAEKIFLEIRESLKNIMLDVLRPHQIFQSHRDFFEGAYYVADASGWLS